jgi:hypothetical protein
MDFGSQRRVPPNAGFACDHSGLVLGPVLNWDFERRTGSDGRGSTPPGRVFVVLR